MSLSSGMYKIYPVDTISLLNNSGSNSSASIGNLKTECFMRVEHRGFDHTAFKSGYGNAYASRVFTELGNIFPLPCYPDSVSESQNGNWQDQQTLGRSSPMSTFTGTGYRSFGLSLRLHREMMDDSQSREYYIDLILQEMRRAVFPYYAPRGYEPPITTFQFGEFRCKGFIRSVSYNWQKPIIDGFYQLCDVSIDFTDVPDYVFSMENLSSKPTNPYNVSALWN